MHPSPSHPPTPYNVLSVILQWFSKTLLKIQQCQLVSQNGYKTLAKRLFQLYSISGMATSSTRELQWLEYLKSIFLEIPNVTTWLDFQTQITYMINLGSNTINSTTWWKSFAVSCLYLYSKKIWWLPAFMSFHSIHIHILTKQLSWLQSNLQKRETYSPWIISNICDCLSKSPTCSHSNWNSFYCPSL